MFSLVSRHRGQIAIATVVVVLGVLSHLGLVAPELLFPAGGAVFAIGSIANANLPPSYVGAIVGSIDPVSQGAATVTTGWVSAAKFLAFMAVIKVGAMGALSTVDAKLQQASDAAGTGAKDVTGKAITQFTATASPTVDANNRQATISCRQEELDIGNGFDFVRLSVTVAVAASLIDGTLYGFYPEMGLASDNQAASVAQNVT